MFERSISWAKVEQSKTRGPSIARNVLSGSVSFFLTLPNRRDSHRFHFRCNHHRLRRRQRPLDQPNYQRSHLQVITRSFARYILC